MVKETLLKMFVDAQGETRPVDILYAVGIALVIFAVAVIEGGVC